MSSAASCKCILSLPERVIRSLGALFGGLLSEIGNVALPAGVFAAYATGGGRKLILEIPGWTGLSVDSNSRLPSVVDDIKKSNPIHRKFYLQAPVRGRIMRKTVSD